MPKYIGKPGGIIAGTGIMGLFLAAAFPLLMLYILTLSPTIPFEDGGEMIRASFTLGVAHPPGYPLYTMIGRLFCLLPVGDIAFRMNLLSAVGVALACGLMGTGVYRIMSAGRGKAAFSRSGFYSAWWPAVLGSLALGLGPPVWWQAVIAEKYGMNLFLNALVFAAIIAGVFPGKRPVAWPVLVGLLYGLSSIHHGQTVYFLPAVAGFLLILLPKIKSGRRGRSMMLFIFMFMLALSVKLMFPPIRAAQNPIHNWMDPSNLSRCIYYLTGGPYHYRIMYWDIPEMMLRLKLHAMDFFPEQLTWPGLVLAVIGFVWFVRIYRGLAMASAGVVIAGVLYCINFALTGVAIRTYYMPIFLVISLWAALGLGVVLRMLRPFGASLIRLALIAAGAGIIWLAWTNRFEAGRDRHYFAYDYSRTILLSVPSRCLLIAYEDRDLFPLWYQQDILNVKPGLILASANPVGSREGMEDQAKATAQAKIDFPAGARQLQEKFPLVADLRKAYPGMPVFFTVVTGTVEDYPLLPRGAVYSLLYGNSRIDPEELIYEWNRFKRWRVIRGIFDESLSKDRSTSVPISYYAYSDYRRGFLLASLGRCRDAVGFFRSALAWPRFMWLGPAGAHAALGSCLLEFGDKDGAEKQYLEAIRAAPAWLPALRALGALYAQQGRSLEARKIFQRIVELDPESLDARRDLAAFEYRKSAVRE